MTVNRQLRLARRLSPDETIGRAQFALTETAVPDPGAGEFLVRTLILGTSPAQRAYALPKGPFHPIVEVGEVMRGRGLGQVVASSIPEYNVGDVVIANTGWQDYSLQAAGRDTLKRSVIEKIEAPVAPLERHLGIFGAPGCTAYFGLHDIGRLRDGMTVVVSSAAGGIGSVAVQLARIAGAKVVGIAGGADKCAWVCDHLGADAAIDYKNEDVGGRLDALCGRGIDLYFDNVGGPALDLVLARLKVGGAVVLCGYIAGEHGPGPLVGPRQYHQLIYRRARMQGFFIWDYVERFGEAVTELRQWHAKGLLRPTEHVTDGLEAMPDVLGTLFTGATAGIRLCRVASDP